MLTNSSSGQFKAVIVLLKNSKNVLLLIAAEAEQGVKKC
jgi:hypothetical protein